MNQIVSVVITTYNEENRLWESINSILDQTYKNIEIIIVDDGSTDKTRQIIQKFEREYTCVESILKEHTGRADSLNRGIWKASGDYIAIHDADDVAREYRVRTQVDVLDNRNDISIVGGGINVIYNSGNKVEIEMDNVLEVNELRQMAIYGMPFAHTTMMFRREVAYTLDGYRSKGYRDYDFVTRALVKYSAVNTGQVLADVYRDNDGVMYNQSFFSYLKRSLYSRVMAPIRLAPIYSMPICVVYSLARVIYGAANFVLKK